MIQVIDDAIPIEIFYDIKKHICSKSFSWLMTKTNSFDSSISFHSSYVNDNHMKNFPQIKSISNQIKQNFDLGDLIRIRIGLIHREDEHKIHAKHVDFKDRKHVTVLWYICGEDGDTYFYDSDDENKIIARVTPKKNRLVVFDGDIKHSSSTPVKEQIRIAINFNYNVK